MLQIWNGYPVWFWLFLLAFVAAGVVQIVLRSRGRGRHAAAIGALCQQRGMTGYGSARPPMLPQMLAMYQSVCSNTFASPDWSFWFSEVNSAQGSAIITNSPGPFAVMMFTVPGVNMPYVAVSRKGRFILATGSLGQSVETESIDFTQRFRIQTEDQRAAVMLLDQGMMQFLMDCDRVSFQISGPIVYAIINRTNLNSQQPTDLALLLKFHDAFAAHIPGLVRNEYAAPPEMAQTSLAVMQQLSNMGFERFAPVISQGRSGSGAPPKA